VLQVDSKVKVRVRGYELEAVEPEVKYGAQFEEREVEFIVGAGDPNVSKVLERIVKDMKKGELCRARVAPSLAPSEHAGQHGVAYEVELLEFVKEKETWEMTNQEKLSACVTSREKGNALFKEGQYKRAAKRYKHAINCVSSDYSMTNEEKAKAKELKLPCHLNMAAWYAALSLYVCVGAASLLTSAQLLEDGAVEGGDRADEQGARDRLLESEGPLPPRTCPPGLYLCHLSASPFCLSRLLSVCPQKY
jgi:hypothetical protein